jgi:2-oxoisovalerate dehydrogenase E2 component (dihydrolipoyl transacylase)
LGGAPGDLIPVGAALITFETDATITSDSAASTAPARTAAAAATRSPAQAAPEAPSAGAASEPAPRPLTSPAIRKRARQAGIDLAAVPATGPGGRVTRTDLDEYLEGRGRGPVAPSQRTGFDEVKVIGVRRAIARRMAESKRTIPHFAYVEEVDVTELESLRGFLNAKAKDGAGLTYLPFLALALVKVLTEFPQCNATYDDERGVIVRHHAIHLGVATQTPDGLKVPVVKHAEGRDLQSLANEIRRVSAAARDGTATPRDLTGSTITISSLGRLGGIVSTPIINAPEVAIIGVNKSVERPMVFDGHITVRRVMNLSSSFDHRFVDGFDAAALIQVIKEHLEHPAMLFMS